MKHKRSMIRITLFPGRPRRRRKLTPGQKFICGLVTAFCALVIFGGTAAILIGAGYTFAQVQDRLDLPIKRAAVSNPERAYAALASQIKYLDEVQNLQNIGAIADQRVIGELERRKIELERLMVDAAALRGRTDAAAMQSAYVLRTRITELPNMAFGITLKLLTGWWGIFAAVVLAFYWFMIGSTIGPYMGRIWQRFEKRMNRLAAPLAA